MATSPSYRRLMHGTLKDLPELEHRDELAGPVMVIIGDAVAGANFERSEALSLAGTSSDLKQEYANG